MAVDRLRVPFVLLLSTLVAAGLGARGAGEPLPAAAPLPAPAPAAAPAAADQQEPDAGANASNDPLLAQLTDLGFQLPRRDVAAIDFALGGLDGIERSLTDYRGRIVFLNFWATWCVPCLTEMPAMQGLHEQLDGDTAFTMIAVNLQEDLALVQPFIDEMGLSFQVLLDTNGRTAVAYGARTLPMSYIIDADGAILARVIGIRPWDEPQYVELFRQLAARS